MDDEPFARCAEDMVIYGYTGSTTESYANEHGFTFRDISTLSEEPAYVPITSVDLNKTSLSLHIGESETLSATISPNNATDKTLIWSSSDEDVASVENGKVTAEGIGDAVITVSTEDGIYKDTCDVSVIREDSSGDSDTDDSSDDPSADDTSDASGADDVDDTGEDDYTVTEADDDGYDDAATEKETISGYTSDNTVISKELPRTGVNMIITSIITITTTLIAIIMYKKYNSYKDIK